ncbi:tRNA lysidine(34) synthetase TilS [Amphritea sp. HPY]|uniref:tRNA lysidine(34) synthetase TilS n=1 Tax=Amphritea sp. HPY TaxID=3421652 RepID=UPI003D7D7CC4
MADIEQQFTKALQQADSRMDIRRWVIGLSGGLDSMVLLALAAKVLPADQIVVLHVDHQLQIRSSQWRDFCQRQAQQRNLSYHSVSVTVDASASLERAARDARYRAFEEFLNVGDCLLLAHHSNDQAETMLYRLLRGAGLRGLSGIPVTRTVGAGRLLRPLLQRNRAELQNWADQNHLDWIDDPSNLDPTFDRNFLRHQVMPLLESRWPGFVGRWQRTAEYMSDADQLLDELAAIDLSHIATKFTALDLNLLSELSLSRQHNLLRFWIARQGGGRISRQQLAVVFSDVIAAQPGSSPELQLGERLLRRYRNNLYLTVASEAGIEWPVLPLTEEGVSLSQGELQVEVADSGLKTLAGVVIRSRREGDRCRPAGRGGSCPLKKLFQEKNIPPWLRAQWPVCVVGDEIVAVPGICICEGWQSEKNVSGFVLKWRSAALSASGESGTL